MIVGQTDKNLSKFFVFLVRLCYHYDKARNYHKEQRNDKEQITKYQIKEVKKIRKTRESQIVSEGYRRNSELIQNGKI